MFPRQLYRLLHVCCKCMFLLCCHVCPFYRMFFRHTCLWRVVTITVFFFHTQQTTPAAAALVAACHHLDSVPRHHINIPSYSCISEVLENYYTVYSFVLLPWSERLDNAPIKLLICDKGFCNSWYLLINKLTTIITHPV